MAERLESVRLDMLRGLAAFSDFISSEDGRKTLPNCNGWVPLFEGDASVSADDTLLAGKEAALLGQIELQWPSDGLAMRLGPVVKLTTSGYEYIVTTDKDNPEGYRPPLRLVRAAPTTGGTDG